MGHAALVFTKGDIEHPVNRVLDAPVASGGNEQARCLVGQTGAVVARVYGGVSSNMPFGLDQHQAGKVAPLLAVIHLAQLCWVRHRSTVPDLQVPMALVSRFVEVVREFGEIGALSLGKHQWRRWGPGTQRPRTRATTPGWRWSRWSASPLWSVRAPEGWPMLRRSPGGWLPPCHCASLDLTGCSHGNILASSLRKKCANVAWLVR